MIRTILATTIVTLLPAVSAGPTVARARALPESPPPAPAPAAPSPRASWPAVQSSAARAAASTPASGLVLGRVVDATTGQPVPRAIVRITPATGQRPTLTGADGTFLFTRLAAGSYRLTASAPGYLDGASGRKRPGGDPAPLVVSDGDRRGDVTIPIWPWATVQGRVIDAAGQPILGALVEVMRALPDGTFDYAGATMTDTQGEWEVTGLPPGRYLIGVPCRSTTAPMPTAAARLATLRASAIDQPSGSVTLDDTGRLFMATAGPQRATLPGAASTSMFVTTYFGGASTAQAAHLLELAAGETSGGLDIVMVERPRVRVDGVVVGPGGPVAGATLNLYPSGVDPSDPANVLFSVATAMSDAGGVFTFLAVPSGDYVLDAVEPSRPVSVSVSADGLPQVVSGPSNGWGKQGLWWRQPLSVGARDIGGLTITLRPGATIRGQVRADPATLAGGPPPGFRVRLGTSAVITADASGRFEITGVPAGRHGFTVSASAVGWRVSQATLNGRDIAGEPLEIDGSDVDGLVVVMSDRLGSVGGTILAGPGQPATDATVALFPADTSAWSYVASDGLRFRSARTLTGQYEFTALPDGDYVLVAIDDAAMAEWPSRDLLQRLSGAGVRVHVAAGQPVTRALTLNPTIR